MQIQIIIEIKTRMFFYDVLISTRSVSAHGVDGTLLKKAAFRSVWQLYCTGHGVYTMPSLTLGAHTQFPPKWSRLQQPRDVHAASVGSGGNWELAPQKHNPRGKRWAPPATLGEGNALPELLNKVCVGWKQMWSWLQVSRTNYHPILSAGGMLHMHPPEAGNSR